jgi:hypothetical protein
MVHLSTGLWCSLGMKGLATSRNAWRRNLVSNTIPIATTTAPISDCEDWKNEVTIEGKGNASIYPVCQHCKCSKPELGEEV